MVSPNTPERETSGTARIEKFFSGLMKYLLSPELEAKATLLKRNPFALLLIYEALILFLLLISLLSNGVDEKTILLAIAVFLPAVAPYIKKLTLFGSEIELIQRIESEVKEEKKRSLDNQYAQERALYALAASIGQNVATQPRRGGMKPARIPIEIGAKDFAESFILAEILHERFNRHRIASLPPCRQDSTLATFFNLRMGKIDLYVEYSGVGFMLAGRDPQEHDAGGGRQMLNEIYAPWGLTWLSPLGFNNQHELVMLRETAEKHGIVTVGDLARSPDRFSFAANREYFLRDTAYPRLLRQGLSFREIREVDISDRLGGLLDGRFDVGVGWTTDPQMEDTRLIALRYDERFPGISQYAMPLARVDIVPEIQEALESLMIDQAQMLHLNKIAMAAGNSPLALKGAAAEFLRTAAHPA